MHSALCCAVTMLLAGVILAAPADAGQRHHHHESDSTGFALGKFGGPEGWTTYVDPDTGTTVDYPANVFSAKDDKPDQNSGVIFRTPDQSAKLAVYFLPNDSHETPHSYVKHHLKIDRSHLSYDRVTRKFFAISGKHGDSTFYSRCNFAPESGNMHCVYLEYPERDEKAWDGIVTRISRSLTVPRIKGEGR